MTAGAKASILLLLTVGIGFAVFLFGRPQEPREAGRERDSSNAATIQPSVRLYLAPQGQEDQGFKFDLSRLYDLSYEVDPELVAYSAFIGLTPSCLIAHVKAQKENQPAPHCGRVRQTDHSAHLLLPGVYEESCYPSNQDQICTRVKTAEHPYEAYSDVELAYMADTSPEAAVILARRTENPQVSARLYKKAVALSGKPGPLEEWMFQKNTGGLVWQNGVLDMEKAKVGYVVYTITGKLGYGATARQKYEEVLIQAGVDIKALDAEASEKFRSLTELRRDLTGNGWES